MRANYFGALTIILASLHSAFSAEVNETLNEDHVSSTPYDEYGAKFNKEQSQRQRFPSCDFPAKDIPIGFAVDKGALAYYNGKGTTPKEALAKLLKSINEIFMEQLNIHLSVGNVLVASENGGDYPWNHGVGECVNSIEGEHQLYSDWIQKDQGVPNCGDKRCAMYYRVTDCQVQFDGGRDKSGTKGYSSIKGVARIFNTGIFTPSTTWGVIAHEFGHNLGYNHEAQGLMKATVDEGDEKIGFVTDTGCQTIKEVIASDPKFLSDYDGANTKPIEETGSNGNGNSTGRSKRSTDNLVQNANSNQGRTGSNSNPVTLTANSHSQTNGQASIPSYGTKNQSPQVAPSAPKARRCVKTKLR